MIFSFFHTLPLTINPRKKLNRQTKMNWIKYMRALLYNSPEEMCWDCFTAKNGYQSVAQLWWWSWPAGQCGNGNVYMLIINIKFENWNCVIKKDILMKINSIFLVSKSSNASIFSFMSLLWLDYIYWPVWGKLYIHFYMCRTISG